MAEATPPTCWRKSNVYCHYRGYRVQHRHFPHRRRRHLCPAQDWAKPMNPEVETLVVPRRCPACFQDQNKVGAECRFCELEPEMDVMDLNHYLAAIERFVRKEWFEQLFFNT